MKKIFTILMALTMILSAFAVSASASTPEPTVSPRWTNTSLVTPQITFSDGVGYAEFSATAKYTPKTFVVDTYVYVQSGSDWIYVTEHHVTKTGMTVGSSCSFDQVTGAYYKADFYLTVSGGGVVEELSFTSYGPN